MALLGVVGEIAAEKVMVRGGGVGSMQISLLDELQLIDQETFERHLRVEVTEW
jgi:hydroxyethylthiazole kinase